MPDHRYALSAEVHEPKHITSTSTADTGKVITPSASVSGVSELRNLTPAEVGINGPADVGVQFVYGEAAIDANTAVTPVTAATSTDLYNTADYSQLVSNASTATPSVVVAGMYEDHSNEAAFDPVDYTLIPTVSGDYRIDFWANVKSSVANTKLGFKAKLNGAWANFTVKSDVKDADRSANIHGNIITTIQAGSPVSLWIASDKTADVTIQDMRFFIQLIKAD